eukprot:1150839-Amphidinium_carterae.1
MRSGWTAVVVPLMTRLFGFARGWWLVKVCSSRPSSRGLLRVWALSSSARLSSSERISVGLDPLHLPAQPGKGEQPKLEISVRAYRLARPIPQTTDNTASALAVGDHK